MFGFTTREIKILKKLNTPIKIQNFLDKFPINWEKAGETYMSPRRSLKAKKIHCLEGALIAALALKFQGQKPLLMDLKTVNGDDHVVALYKIHGRWGAISKTNHAALRFRDPIYKNIRELALSYFHEYFSNANGKKILREYSGPFNLNSKYGGKWITDEKDLFYIAEDLDDARHYKIFPKQNIKYIRPADKMELKAGRIIEWKKNHPRT